MKRCEVAGCKEKATVFSKFVDGKCKEETSE